MSVNFVPVEEAHFASPRARVVCVSIAAVIIVAVVGLLWVG
jgi:hypothetical protein